MQDSLSIGTTIAGAVLAPLLATMLAYAMGGPGERRDYEGLVPFGIASAIVAMAIHFISGRVWPPQTDAVANPIWPAITRAFVRAALVEEGIKISAFLLWLRMARRPQPRDALFAAVAIAMTFAAMENFNFLLRDVSHVEPLLRDAAIRSLLSTPSAAADPFVVGIWAAVGIAEKGRVVVARVLTGLAFAILAHGVWDASAFLAAPFFPTGDASSWSAAPAWTFVAGGMLASISIDTLGLVIGMQRLALSGVRFRLPYRF